jgi:hypothetical protein
MLFRLLPTLSICLLVVQLTHAQSVPANEKPHEPLKFTGIFSPDSSEWIYPSALKNGIVLTLNDTTYRVLSFVFTYNDCEGRIIERPVLGNRTAIDKNDPFFDQHAQGTVITLDAIRAAIGGRQIKLPSIVRYIVRDMGPVPDPPSPTSNNWDDRSPGWRCQVYELTGDSGHLQLSSDTLYSGSGQVLSYHSNKLFNKDWSRPDYGYGCINWWYKGKLMATVCGGDRSFDSTMTLFQYDDAGKKTVEEHFDYARRMRTDRYIRGYYSHDSSEYEIQKRWLKTDAGYHFFYNVGVGKNQVTIDACGERERIISYDGPGRVLTDSLFSAGDLKWVDVTEYFKGRFVVTRMAADSNFSFTTTYVLNRRGKVVEEYQKKTNGQSLRNSRTLYKRKRILETRDENSSGTEATMTLSVYKYD